MLEVVVLERRAKNRRAIVRPNNITQNVIIQITRPYLDMNYINSQIQLFLSQAETTNDLYVQSRLYIQIMKLYEKIGKTDMVVVYSDKVAEYYSNIGDNLREQADLIPYHSDNINPYETNYISPFAKAEKYKDAAGLYRYAIKYSSKYIADMNDCYRSAVNIYITIGDNAAEVFDYPLASQAYALAAEIATNDSEKNQYTVQSEAYKLMVS